MGALQDPSVPATSVEIPAELLGGDAPTASVRLEELKKLESRPIGQAAPAETGLGGAFAATVLVVGLLLGAFLLLRKFMGRTRLFASGSAVRILARRPLAPRQEVILLEIGSRVLIVGATRDSLSRLGEVTGAEEIASLRARCGMPASDPAAPKTARPCGERAGPEQSRGAEGESNHGNIPTYDGVVEELSRIRTTVRDWTRQEVTP